MSPEPLQVIAAAVMLGITFALILAFREYLASSSERRLGSMLARVGVDPAPASSKRRDVITRELRQRCRNCACEDLCERWLRGEVQGAPDFCPNSKVFRTLN